MILNFLYIVAFTPKCCYESIKNDKRITFNYAFRGAGLILLQNYRALFNSKLQKVDIFYFHHLKLTTKIPFLTGIEIL